MSIEKPLQNYTTNDIREWLLLYKETGVSNVTVNNVRRIFSSFFSWLEAEEYILRDPMRRIHRVKEEYQVKKAYSEWEIERLRIHLKDSVRDRAIFELLHSYDDAFHFSGEGLKKRSEDKIVEINPTGGTVQTTLI